MSRDGSAGRSNAREGDAQARSLAEWVSLGLSTAVLLAIVGLLTYQQFAAGGGPPTIAVEPRLDALRREGDRYYVPVSVTNRGDEAAEDVRVRLVLGSASARPEAAELEFRFLAGGETDEGIAVFRADPAAGDLTVDVITFLAP